MLTVWRKLNIEVDRMEKWTGAKPTPDAASATGASWAPPSARTTTLTLDAFLPYGSLNFYERGYVKSGSTIFDIVSTTIKIQNPGNAVSAPAEDLAKFIGSAFEVYDDDDQLDGHNVINQLPVGTAITDAVKGYYARAFILIEEVPASENPRGVLPFTLNSQGLDYLPNPLVANEDKNGDNDSNYWSTLLAVAYQYVEREDGDGEFPLGKPESRMAKA